MLASSATWTTSADEPASFDAPLRFAGFSPLDVAAGDFDGDGRLDAVVLSGGDDTVHVLLGDGAGDVTPRSLLELPGAGVRQLVVGDIDADGDLDVLVSCFAVQQVAVLVNDGTGTLVHARSITDVLAPQGMALADLDADGAPDLVVCVQGGLVVARNEGGGTFGAPQLTPRPGTFQRVAIGDVNADGQLDAVAIDVAEEELEVFLGSIFLGSKGGLGDGGSEPMVGADSSTSIFLADLDGDGALDVGFGIGRIGLRAGDGAGGFGRRLPIDDLTASVTAVAVADADGDGILDVVALLDGRDALAVHPGNGVGAFGAPRLTWLRRTPVALDLAHLDDDGRLDALVVAGSLAVLRGEGEGLFRRYVRTAQEDPPNIGFPAIGDFNGDGVLDLFARSTNEAYRAIGDGAGGFGLLELWPFPGPNPSFIEVAAADLDRNGRDELVLLQSNWVDVYRRTDADALAFVQRVTISGSGSNRSMAIADVDADGWLDIVVARFAEAGPRILFGRGGGPLPLELPVAVVTDVRVSGVAVGDLDGDGTLDLVFLAPNEGGVVAVRGLPGRQFGPPVLVVADAGTGQMAGPGVGDVTGDGLDDVVLGTRDLGSLSFGKLWMVRGDAVALAGDAELVLAGGVPSLVRVVDVDGDRRPDVLASLAGAGLNGITVLRAGDDGLSAPRTHLDGASPSSIAIADLDGSGTPDLAISALSYGIAVSLNRWRGCPLDFDGDGRVGHLDLIAVLAAWGPCTDPCPWDADGDGAVDMDDLMAVLDAWGPCVPSVE